MFYPGKELGERFETLIFFSRHQVADKEIVTRIISVRDGRWTEHPPEHQQNTGERGVYEVTGTIGEPEKDSFLITDRTSYVIGVDNNIRGIKDYQSVVSLDPNTGQPVSEEEHFLGDRHLFKKLATLTILPFSNLEGDDPSLVYIKQWYQKPLEDSIGMSGEDLLLTRNPFLPR